jgi:diguanylate cyclase (GGDEF)-like protein
MNHDDYKIPEDVKVREKRIQLFDDIEKYVRGMKIGTKISIDDREKLINALSKAKIEYEDLYSEHLLGRKYPQLYTPSYLKGKLNEALNEIAVQKGLRKGQINMFKGESTHAVVMIDLDDFKHINDNYGHLVGDEVLNKVSNIIKRVADKHNGIAAKYGGEEFQLWFKDKDIGETRKISKELIDNIREETKQPPSGVTPEKWKGLTASAGFATHNMIKRDDRLTADVLTDLADKALYGAKAKGKNTVKSADEV